MGGHIAAAVICILTDQMPKCVIKKQYDARKVNFKLSFPSFSRT